MRKRSFLPSLAAATLAATLAVGPASAENVPVHADAGGLGTFVLTNNGEIDGVWSYTLDLSPENEQNYESINGVNVGVQDAAFGATINFTVTGGVAGLVYQITSATYQKTFFSPETGGRDASLTYTLLNGSTGDAGSPGIPGLEDELNLAGLINGVGDTGSILDLIGGPYDFSTLVDGNIVIALTAQTYTGAGVSSMGELMSTAGATARGGVAQYSQGTAAIPEPTSVALMGIGLSGLLFYRRRLVKRSLAV